MKPRRSALRIGAVFCTVMPRLWLLLAIVSLVHPHSGFGAETTGAIRFFEERVERDPDDFLAWNQLAARYSAELRRTGDDRFVQLAQRAAERSLAVMPAEQNPGGLTALAEARLAAHRFSEAQDAVEKMHSRLPEKTRPLELLFDAQFELGDYPTATRTVDVLAGLDGESVSVLARRARLDLVHGRIAEARKHFEHGVSAANDAPEVNAWFRVQLGLLAFKTGDWETAEQHYIATAKAFPEGYLADDHLAELRGAQGRYAEAIALYEKLIARIPRPEFFQALGDLHHLAKQPKEADARHAQAEAAYLRSVESGAVHFHHHLAGFYADSKEDPAKSVEWARKDLALRQSIHAYDALAWALYKNGQVTEALEPLKKALATGTRDAHILYHAGLIRMAAGDLAGGKTALQQAAAANPKFNSFHVHR